MYTSMLSYIRHRNEAPQCNFSRRGPAAQARKQFLNSSAGRWLNATFTLRAWAAGVIALLSLEPEDNRLQKYF